MLLNLLLLVNTHLKNHNTPDYQDLFTIVQNQRKSKFTGESATLATFRLDLLISPNPR